MRDESGRASVPMVQIEHVSKVFVTKNNDVKALQDVSLTIMKGDIHGIIGFSGAGKSTLVRCINLLEKPTSGKITVDGAELTAMCPAMLRVMRKKIGMIFQLFNLMRSRTVYGNVAFPLKGTGLTKQQKHDKVTELLRIVGLEEKANAYPSELSGGQKQRVAIARALANEPNVLLCDEATSALDPQTTQDILRLLKELNEKLGITIVLITHEMAVVKEICNRVAVMEDGRIVEEGDIYTVFSNPQQMITKRFIGTTEGVSRLRAQLGANPDMLGLKPEDKIVLLEFQGNSAGYALVSNLSREYDIDISIIYGNVEMISGIPLGKLIVVMRGKCEQIHKAIASIDNREIRAEVIEHA